MMRWNLKRIQVTDGVDGQSYQRDVRLLEYMENGKWIEVPQVDTRQQEDSL